MNPENIEAKKEFGSRHIFKVFTGACYIGGYIEYDKSNIDWLRERILTLEENINTISKTAGKYPQKSCHAVVCAIQSEWTFLQTVTWYTGDAFRRIGEDYSGKLFALSFLWKDKNPFTHRRNSKYDDDQDGHTGTPESIEISKGEIPKLSAGKNGTD